MSPNAKMMLNLFLPYYAAHCMEQIYFIYGTVLQHYSLSPKIIGWILSCYFITIMGIRSSGSGSSGVRLKGFGMNSSRFSASAILLL